MLPFLSDQLFEILAFASHGFLGDNKTIAQSLISRALEDDHFTFSLATYIQRDMRPPIDPRRQQVSTVFGAQRGVQMDICALCASKINLLPEGYDSSSLTLTHPI